MTYELAKKLKEAGFPLHEPDGEPAEKHACHCGGYERDECTPTLSELIEACPKEIDEGIFTLQIDQEGGWDAGYMFYESWLVIESGPTPEEAVANLWLALNEKK